MRLKVTFDRPHGSVDLNIMADATATVGDLAGQIAATDPASEGPCGTAVTLRISDIFVPGQTPRVLDAETCLLDADLRSGSRIELTSRQPGSDAHRPAAALLEVISGPDTGKQFFLPDGVSLLGRDPGSDIVLDDPSVSKQHARITVTDAVEIADLNSANGVVVSGDVVANAAVTGTDVVILGDSSVRVELLHPADASPGPVIEQLRSPRVVPRYPGGEFPAPVPPTVPQPQRFPFVALAAPLIIGAALFLITASVLSVVMMALTPVLLIGSAIDQRLSSRRSLKMQKKRFGAAMLQLHETLEREREDERRVRRIEAPSVSDAIRAIEDRSSLLWTRRPEHAEFGWLTWVRVGPAAEMSSRCRRPTTPFRSTGNSWSNCGPPLPPSTRFPSSQSWRRLAVSGSLDQTMLWAGSLVDCCYNCWLCTPRPRWCLPRCSRRPAENAGNG